MQSVYLACNDGGEHHLTVRRTATHEGGPSPGGTMNGQTGRMYTGQEAATAYAVAAERVFGDDGAFLNANPCVVPIFVSNLFQSLEISIKTAGIESGLFVMEEARARENRAGHGIKELAALGRTGQRPRIASRFIVADRRGAVAGTGDLQGTVWRIDVEGNYVADFVALT